MRTATIKTGLGIQSCILQDYLNKFIIIINRTRKSTFVARNKNWRKRGVLPPPPRDRPVWNRSNLL